MSVQSAKGSDTESTLINDMSDIKTLRPPTAQAAKPYLPYLVPVAKGGPPFPPKKKTLLQVHKLDQLKVRIPEARILGS